MIYIIDHQDSFTWNVVHQFSEFDEVYCSNYFDINKKLLDKSKTIVFSPGPGSPKDYPTSIKIYNKFKGTIEKIDENIYLSKGIYEVIGNKIIKFILKINCNEFTTSYRGFNLLKLNNFHLNKIKSKGYSFFMETIFRINQSGYKIFEIPIYFRNRTQGKSKIPKIEILRTLFNLFKIKFF